MKLVVRNRLRRRRAARACGPAARLHTSKRACFYRTINGDEPTPTLSEALPASSTRSPPARDRSAAGSYTAKLNETTSPEEGRRRGRGDRARRARRGHRIDNEAADLLYHLLVVMKIRGRTLGDAGRVLLDRRG